MSYSQHGDTKIDELFERQKRAIDPLERKKLTREFEQYAQNGERFIVILDCDATWTTESLVASPGYQAVAQVLTVLNSLADTTLGLIPQQ